MKQGLGAALILCEIQLEEFFSCSHIIPLQVFCYFYKFVKAFHKVHTPLHLCHKRLPPPAVYV